METISRKPYHPRNSKGSPCQGSRARLGENVVFCKVDGLRTVRLLRLWLGNGGGTASARGALRMDNIMMSICGFIVM